MSARRLVMLAALGLVWTGLAAAEERMPLPEDPMAGARLFREKGCIRCHSMGSGGGRAGPDLARIHRKGSLLDIAGTLWNHAPAMLEKMRELRMPPPRMTGQEMADLIAFLSAYQYYLKQLGSPGDPEKGKQLFEAKRCAQCHSLERQGSAEKRGPNLRGYGKLSAIQVAQAMWNHGPEMAQELRKLGLSPPQFADGEMADLLAYLQRATASPDGEPVYVEPGSPNRGRLLFEQKGCTRCHAIRGTGGAPGVPDLGKRREELVRSVAEVAGFLWNHGEVMWESMRRRQLPPVRFEKNEMADIIAYLYFVNYFDEPGDVAAGRELFVRKSCSRCHTVGDLETKAAANLRTSPVVASPIETVSAMWNDAKEMEEQMRAEGIPWPRFEPGEMRDLMEFLHAEHGKPSPGQRND
jgi:cytochrome c2